MVFPMLTNALVKIFLVGPVLDMASGVHSGESHAKGVGFCKLECGHTALPSKAT